MVGGFIASIAMLISPFWLGLAGFEYALNIGVGRAVPLVVGHNDLAVLADQLFQIEVVRGRLAKPRLEVLKQAALFVERQPVTAADAKRPAVLHFAAQLPDDPDFVLLFPSHDTPRSIFFLINLPSLAIGPKASICSLTCSGVAGLILEKPPGVVKNLLAGTFS